MKTIPKIQKFMTYSPHSIGSDQTVLQAENLMREHKIRHLPVLHQGTLTGLLSDRDVKLYKGLRGTDPATDTVQEVMHEEVFTTTPESDLIEVAKEMIAKKHGSTLVIDNNKLVGIFTYVDALKALVELSETRLK
jgi:acetoin utilization protein AcuB